MYVNGMPPFESNESNTESNKKKKKTDCSVQKIMQAIMNPGSQYVTNRHIDKSKGVNKFMGLKL